MSKIDVKEIRDKLGLSQYKFAQRLGISLKTVQNWEAGRTIPESRQQFLLSLLNKQDDKEERTLPLLPVEVVAGKPMGDIDSIDFSQCEQYVVPDFIYHGAQMLIRVSGNSMSTRYKHGDILAIRKETFFPQWGQIYVVDSSEGVLIKRIIEDKYNHDCVICRSENRKTYPDYHMRKSSIRNLFIIVGVIRIE